MTCRFHWMVIFFCDRKNYSLVFLLYTTLSSVPSHMCTVDYRLCDSMSYYMSRGYPTNVRKLTAEIRNRETFFGCQNTVYSLYSV